MRKLFTGLAAAVLLCGPAAAAEYTQGVHYQELSQPQPVSTGEKIEVRELFWYGCPHCYRLEPTIQSWLENGKPENAEYVPMPAVLRDSWAFHGRVYYTFEALGMVDELHSKFFDALHRERRRITNVEQLAEWASQYGVEEQAVIDAFNSFAVETKMRQARVLVGKYQATGVPTMIVDGKYRTTGSMAGSNEELMRVVNYLVGLAAEERGS